jgi:acetoacetyl-CoA synthetase
LVTSDAAGSFVGKRIGEVLLDKPLWQPSADQIEATNLAAFLAAVEERWGTRHEDYAALHAWSVREPEKFWLSLWDFTGVISQTRGKTVLRDQARMPGATWFPDARLNFAENLLRCRDDAPALVFRGETGIERTLSHAKLYDLVSRLAQGLKDAGVVTGDRVAGYLPNMPESVAAMLAVASLGAIWSSCSPDFGVQGVLDRFGQIEPKIFVAVDRYFYNGKSIDCLPRIAEVTAQLPTVERVVLLPYDTDDRYPAGAGGAQTLDEFIAPFAARDIDFRQLPFNTPLYILFSSGTTGIPKCIVHGAGGTLLQHLKEHVLQSDVKPDDRIFYFTTLGWMMWNWLVSGLATGATILLYDGSPFHPDGNSVFDFADSAGMTHLGTSAKYIDAVKKAGLRPRETHKLSSLRAVLSTGSPLVAESFDYVYADVKADLCLSSISGGTDIVACFVAGNPTGPVWRGEIQAPCLGMDVAVYDPDGESVVGEKGELVCRRPFPSMPVGFWNDPDGSKYRAAYFARFPGVWCHGDWAEFTAHGGVIIYGRSDATLNPGGVRIGTAEIYRQVEQIDAVEEAIAVGQEWDGDIRIILFVRLRADATLDDTLIADIRNRVRSGASPRHVPAVVAQVTDIPRTKSGKITELAVRDVIHGRLVQNVEALANPEALDEYRDRPELQR